MDKPDVYIVSVQYTGALHIALLHTSDIPGF